MSGPLDGVRIVEIAGIGPGPFAGLMLSDMGAEVIRVDRLPGPRDASAPPARTAVLNRGRRSIAVDLKSPSGVEVVLGLAARADALFEPFRPGVAERLGIGPEACHERNPRLVYGRVTGWGQNGPYAAMPGHDIDYIALSGALEPIGRRGERPVPPLNLVGDFAGGGMLLAFGIACALIEARASARGQVIDAAMVDGSALLMSLFYGWAAEGRWAGERGTNLVDTGAPFYEVYETADAKHIAVGAIEPQFYAALLDRLGLQDDPDLADQHDQRAWPRMKLRFAEVFRTRTRDAWWELLRGSDACAAPVLTPEEAPHDPHNLARDAFVDVAGVVQPAPAPRFSRTPAAITRPPARPGRHTDEILEEWLELGQDERRELRRSGAVAG